MDPRSQIRSAARHSAATHPHQTAAHPPVETHHVPVAKHGKKPSKKKILLWAGIGLLVAALLGFALWHSMRASDMATIQEDKHQAVFLANGQVYFGDITAITDDTIRLENIYYIQQKDVPSAPSEKNAEAAQQEQVEADNTSLVKLGEEIHAPEDAMYLNRDQVLFWENLKSEGQVSEAIKAYKQQ